MTLRERYRLAKDSDLSPLGLLCTILLFLLLWFLSSFLFIEPTEIDFDNLFEKYLTKYLLFPMLVWSFLILIQTVTIGMIALITLFMKDDDWEDITDPSDYFIFLWNVWKMIAGDIKIQYIKSISRDIYIEFNADKRLEYKERMFDRLKNKRKRKQKVNYDLNNI